MFEGGDELVVLDLSESDERVDTRGERIVADNIVGGGLHDGCFESGNGLLDEDCSREVGEGGVCEAEWWGTG